MSDFLRSKNAANRAIRRELNRIKEEGVCCYAFGGFARSVYMAGAEAAPKDIDLVFDRPNYDRFISCFSSSLKKTNRFGGSNLQLGGVDVDAWSLDDTWAFKQGYFGEASFSALPATTYLSADAIVVQLWSDEGKPRKVFSKGFFETFDRGLLDVNLDPNPFPELTVVRTLVAAKRNCFGLSATLARSSRDILIKCGLSRVYDAQMRHYKKQFLPYNELQDIFLKLITHVNNKPGSAFFHFREEHQRMLPLISETKEDDKKGLSSPLGIQLNLF